jgi:hypothetical protein
MCLLFFWRDLTPVAADRWAFEPGDFAQQFYAFSSYEATRWQAGQLPLWNPYNRSGQPFLADIQAAVFYPLSLLTMLVTRLLLGRTGFPYFALELEALAHYPLAAIFTYLLARRLTGSRVGALTAAIAFAFGGYLTSYPPLQLAILETHAWLPLLLLCLDLAGERLERGEGWAALRWTILAGLTFGIALLAGHPQAGLLLGYAGLGYGLFRFWPRPAGWEWRRWSRPLGLLAAWGLIGAGLAAVQLVPSVEYTVSSVRSSVSFDEAGVGFQPYELIQLIFPVIGGRFSALYVGLLPLGLAIVAVIGLRRDPGVPASARRMIGFLSAAVLVALLISFGKNLGLYQLVYLFVPGWRLFRSQERVVVWLALAVALLAGYAAAWLSGRWTASRSAQSPLERWLTWGYGLGAVLALTLAAAFFVKFQAGSSAAWGFTSASVFLTVLLGLAVLALRSRNPVWLIAYLALDLFTINQAHHAVPASQVNLAPFRSLLAVPLADQDAFRVKNDDCLPIGFGLLDRLEDIGGPSPLSLRRYEEWLSQLPAERAWRLLNVKYVISWQQSLELPVERIAQEPGPDKKPVYLYRVLDPLPRAWLTGQAVVEPNFQKTLDLLAGPDFDPARQVVVASLPAGFAPAADCRGTVHWRRRDPEHLALDVTVTAACLLVLSEVDYPGWQAQIGGAPAPILRGDGILRVVALPAGAHEVTLDFRPVSVRIGEAVSTFTLLAAGGLLLVSWRAKVQPM